MERLEVLDPKIDVNDGKDGLNGLKNILRVCRRSWKMLVFVLIPIALLPIPLVIQSQEAAAGYVVCIMAVYWLTETIPLAVTALLPVVLYPLFGIASTSTICLNYMKEVMVMTLGSLMLGVAMEHHNAHKRLALKSLLLIGTSPRRLLLGFLSTAAFLSTITTNSATASMMIPVVKAVIDELQNTKDANTTKSLCSSFDDLSAEDRAKSKEFPEYILMPKEGSSRKRTTQKNFQIGLLLCVAYGTSIGGTGTLTGASPNLILMALVQEKYPHYTRLSYGSWMLYSIPGVILAVLSCWVVLQIFHVNCRGDNNQMEKEVKEIILRKYKELGAVTFAEKVIALLFFVLLLLWFFRDPNFIPGWISLFSSKVNIGNATPAMAVAILLFIIPSKPSVGSPPILDWNTTHHMIPWSIMLLLGGGLALADGANRSGLMAWVAVKLQNLHFMPPLALIFTLCIMTLGITEFTSNTSTASMLLPVLAQLATILKLHPLYLMLPVTMCCSYAFMLPMATSPNALVYQSSDMKTKDMAIPGFFLNLIGCSIQVMMISVLGDLIFDFHTSIDGNMLNSTKTEEHNLFNVTHIY